MVAITPTAIDYRRCFDADATDPDAGRDICDAFERDVAELAYLDLRMHGHTISVRNAPVEFERFAIDAAERLTETIDADLPW